MLGCLLYAVLCGCAFSMFETYVPSLHTMLLQRGCRWLGHVARMSPHRIPHAVLFGTIPHRSFLSATELGAVSHHYTGRARMWMQSLLGDRAALWARIVQDKLAWQHQVNACQVEALSRHGALVRNYRQPAVAEWQPKFAQDVVLLL